MSIDNRAQSPLFEPYQLGDITLTNRIVMAPMTRSRAVGADVPSDLAVEYYKQRAAAGLIITEGSQISPQGKGYILTPGIHSAEQIAGWRKVTEAVHAAGGRIFLQLWHVGRISHRALQPNGELPVAPSAILPNGQAYIESGFVPLETPRALELSEMPGIVEQFRKGAENAYEAGFDGVEVHAANGYLLDQFLRSGTNQRSDAYGGSPENRARLVLEVTEAVMGVWGSGRVGVRISPMNEFGDIRDADPAATYGYLAARLNEYDLAYLHIVEGSFQPATDGPSFDARSLRDAYDGHVILSNGYDFEKADAALRLDQSDLIAFGKPFISNPDLVHRLKIAAPLTDVDASTIYGGGAKGYTDYPTLAV